MKIYTNANHALKVDGSSMTIASLAGRHIEDISVSIFTGKRFGSPVCEVNWSAMGSVSPELAALYAELLAAAAVLAAAPSDLTGWTEVESVDFEGLER